MNALLPPSLPGGRAVWEAWGGAVGRAEGWAGADLAMSPGSEHKTIFTLGVEAQASRPRHSTVAANMRLSLLTGEHADGPPLQAVPAPRLVDQLVVLLQSIERHPRIVVKPVGSGGKAGGQAQQAR